jgi:two-component system sensor histidine kinase BaeS
MNTALRTFGPPFGVALGLTSKLFVALLVVILIAATTMSVPISVSARRIVESPDDQGMGRVQRALVATYQEHGNWDFLRGNPRAWLELLGDFAAQPLAQDQVRSLPETGSPRQGQQVPMPTLIPPELGPGIPMLTLVPMSLRLALWDDMRRFMVGDSQLGPDTPARPIVVNGRVVGWLAGTAAVSSHMMPLHVAGYRRIVPPWIMGAGAVLVAALAGVLLTHWLLRPIRDIAEATHRLAAGDYTTRLTLSSHDEIGHLADDFNQLATALEKNELTRRDFMADISHELRTPLAVLRGELEAIEDGVRTLTLVGIQSLQSEVQTIGKLVDDLHDLSLADVGALTYHMADVDIAETLRERLRGFRERLTERHIELEWDISEQRLIVNGDAVRLQQLFGNLLENSLHYTTPEGVLRISCHRKPTQVVIDFQDSEPGVPDEMVPRLFERFFRVEASRNRDTGGAGLGLAICKSIVEAHRGTISAQASPLGGLWISIRLPAVS